MLDEAQDITENERAYLENMFAKHELAEANAKMIKS